MITFRRLLPLLLMLSPVALLAQNGHVIPVNGQTVDYLGQITAIMDAMLNDKEGLFVDIARRFVDMSFLFIGVLMLIAWGLERVFQKQFVNTMGLLKFFFQYVIAVTILQHWTVPFPVIGHSVSEFFRYESRTLQNILQINAMDVLLDRMHAIWTNTERPSILNPQALLVYLLVMIFMFAVNAVMFIVTAQSYFALAIGSLLGPLALCGYLWPRFQHVWWGWINFMLHYSLYRVIAAAMLFVWCNFLVNWIDQTVHGDLSLAHWFGILPEFMIVNLAGIVLILGVPHMAREIVSGSSGSGAGMGSLITSLFVRFA